MQKSECGSELSGIAKLAVDTYKAELAAKQKEVAKIQSYITDMQSVVDHVKTRTPKDYRSQDCKDLIELHDELAKNYAYEAAESTRRAEIAKKKVQTEKAAAIVAKQTLDRVNKQIDAEHVNAGIHKQAGGRKKRRSSKKSIRSRKSKRGSSKKSKR